VQRRRRRRERRLAAGLLLLAAALVGIAIVSTLSLGTGDDPATARPGPAASERATRPARGTSARSAAASADSRRPRRSADAVIAWRDSRAIGTWDRGRLVRGVQLPPEGAAFFTWDPVKYRTPNRSGRRYATAVLIRRVLRVLNEYARAHPNASRVGIGDLSRKAGGDFGRRFGPIAHVSHQNGLDADIYYPRRDGPEKAPFRPAQVDRALAQDLVDRFVRAGALRVFVGPRSGLSGPPAVVQALPKHDDHLHVRFVKPGTAPPGGQG